MTAKGTGQKWPPWAGGLFIQVAPLTAIAPPHTSMLYMYQSGLKHLFLVSTLIRAEKLLFANTSVPVSCGRHGQVAACPGGRLSRWPP